jgi:hypothetical protein
MRYEYVSLISYTNVTIDDSINDPWNKSDVVNEFTNRLIHGPLDDEYLIYMLNECIEWQLIDIMINILDEYDYIVNIPTVDGDTLLHIAIDIDNPYLVNILLDYNADIYAKDRDGTTCVSFAAKIHRINILNILNIY